MDEQREWLRAIRKRHLRILAVMLCFCVLFTTCPDILAALSVFASEQSEQSEIRYISGFTALSKETREQTVPVGTALEEISLPDTLEAVITEEKKPSEDMEDKWEDSRKEDTGENGGNTEETEDDGPSDTGEENTETGDEQDTQQDETEKSEETGESTETENEDEADTDSEEDSEGESASFEEPEEGETAQETHTVTMPEYQAESVISVQTLENTQAEKQEETVTISGIRWQSNPKYDGSTGGTYIFTAVLPGGYTLAEGVSLPEITVTVESSTDAMIQTLLNRIAALPDAEEYLAAEPDMDDEEAYVAWEEKLYEYAREALAIWEEYGALAEEQQTWFSEENLEKLTAWAEIAKTVRESAQVMAADIVDRGECGAEGGNVTWELDAEGVLTIRGSGAMCDYWFRDSPFRNSSDIKEIIIADGVTSIGVCAFDECQVLTAVEIPSSVTSIGQEAFYSCVELQSIKIPFGVTSIGLCAFWDCTSLKSVEIPSSVTSIEYAAFEGCDSLRDVEIPSSVTSIGDSAFAYCGELQSIKIPSGVTNTGEKIFFYCSGLKSVEISSGVKSIGTDAFSGTALTEVTIPDSVESIDQWAFDGCSNLATVSFQGKVPPTLGERVFSGCDKLTTIYIPSCQYLEAYRAAEGWSTYEKKITASEHDGFTYTANDAVLTQTCACQDVSATATLSIREGQT